MSFELEQKRWLDDHMSRRNGMRRDALKRGHGYGNQLFLREIWWMLLGHFRHLHPEYEVLDWRGFPFYADFALIMGWIRIIFEIQDFGSHVQRIDRDAYKKELNRGLFLRSLQFQVIYIPLDGLKDNPDLIRSMIRNILAPYLEVSDGRKSSFGLLDRELMRMAICHQRILRPIDAARHLQVTVKTVINHLQYLETRGKFKGIPTRSGNRINHYEYIGSFTDSDLY